jgi:hypothetical protein
MSAFLSSHDDDDDDDDDDDIILMLFLYQLTPQYHSFQPSGGTVSKQTT